MLQGLKRRPLYGLLLLALAGVALPANAAMAKSNPDPVSQVRAGSFAGAYLAARTAEADNNIGAAVDFYRQAMAFDPGNDIIKQNLLLALLTEGRFKDALPIAEELKNQPEIE